MTVKCLNDSDKMLIASCYFDGIRNTAELAAEFGVSTRTINRVCVELSVARSPMRRTKHDSHQHPLEFDNTPVPQSEVPPVLHIDMIELTFAEKVKCMLKAIFFRNNKANAPASR